MSHTIFNKVFIILLAFTFTACAVYGREKEDICVRQLAINTPFKGIKAEASMEIIYTQDNKKSKAIIRGDKDIVDGITWIIDSEGVLSFKYPTKKRRIINKITIELNGDVLTKYIASSAGIIRLNTEITQSETIHCIASSSGKIYMLQNIDVKDQNINITTSSSAKVEFTGSITCNKVKTTCSSSGLIKIKNLNTGSLYYTGSSVGLLEILDLKTTKTNATVSSGAECDIKEADSETVNITASSGAEFTCRDITSKSVSLITSSGGTITLKGKCDKATMQASSGGDINIKDMNITKIVSQKTSSGGRIKM